MLNRQEFSSLRQGLVGAWCPSLGASGLTLIDRSGQNNHGALVNMGGQDNWRASGSGVALNFDGTNDYVDLGLDRVGRFGSGSFAVSVWCRSAISKTMSYLSDNTSGLNDRASIEFFDVAGVFWARSNIGGSQITCTGGTQTVGLWNHVCAAYNGAAFALYGNGVLIQTQAASGSVYQTPTSMRLGMRGTYDNAPSWNYNGQLDDIRIYNRALTPAEIRLLSSRRGVGLLPIADRAASFGRKLSVNVGGTWKDGDTYLNVGGVWKLADPKINVGGVWK